MNRKILVLIIFIFLILSGLLISCGKGDTTREQEVERKVFKSASIEAQDVESRSKDLEKPEKSEDNRSGCSRIFGKPRFLRHPNS